MEIVAIQLDMKWQDCAENFARVEELAEQAEIQPGSLVVLPEMFATGFSMDVSKTSQGPQRESEALLKKLAAQYDAAFLGGVVDIEANGKSSNQAVAFAPDGSELVRYTKQQPFSLSGEGDHYPAGDTFQLFQWQDTKIAPFVCYDLRFPELFRPSVAAGAELIIVIACWPQARSEHWVRLLQARAIENLAAVVGVNRCGCEPGLEFDGRSTAFDHMGLQLFELDEQQQTVKASIDVDLLRKWRRKFPALRDMRLS